MRVDYQGRSEGQVAASHERVDRLFYIHKLLCAFAILDFGPAKASQRRCGIIGATVY
jgi:hypothetical protein